MQRNSKDFNVTIKNKNVTVHFDGIRFSTQVVDDCNVTDTFAYHGTNVVSRQSSIAPQKAKPTYPGFFAAPTMPPNVFRLYMLECIQQDPILKQFMTNKYIHTGFLGPFSDSSIRLQPEEFTAFMKLVNEQKIKELNFIGCDLQENSGKILGDALQRNTSLETLAVTSSQLGEEGMIALLEGLQMNKSVTSLSCYSYNMCRHNWSYAELQALISLITTNNTIKEIKLPNNDLDVIAKITLLANAYKNAGDKQLATISGFSLHWSSLPDFNKENALNGELDKCAKITFKP